MAENEDWQRLQREVSARIKKLDLKQAEIQARGGPSPAKVREVTSGRATILSPSKRRDLERALEWATGSVDDVLAGGDPTPTLGGVVLSEPETPSVGDSNSGPGLRPGSLAASLVMSTRERQMLAEVRNKLIDQSALTSEESQLLTKFVEEEELRTLHVRIDWLPRAEQLEVSALVNDLHMKIENRRIADGPGLQPGYAEPNPLPRDGITPDQLEEEDDDALSGDQTAKSDAQGEAIKVEEVPALDDDPEGGETSLLPRGIPDDGPRKKRGERRDEQTD